MLFGLERRLPWKGPKHGHSGKGMSAAHAHETYSQLSWTFRSQEIGFTAWEANQEVGWAEVSNSSLVGSLRVTEGLNMPRQDTRGHSQTLTKCPSVERPPEAG